VRGAVVHHVDRGISRYAQRPGLLHRDVEVPGALAVGRSTYRLRADLTAIALSRCELLDAERDIQRSRRRRCEHARSALRQASAIAARIGRPDDRDLRATRRIGGAVQRSDRDLDARRRHGRKVRRPMRPPFRMDVERERDPVRRALHALVDRPTLVRISRDDRPSRVADLAVHRHRDQLPGCEYERGGDESCARGSGREAGLGTGGHGGSSLLSPETCGKPAARDEANVVPMNAAFERALPSRIPQRPSCYAESVSSRADTVTSGSFAPVTGSVTPAG
jgi:hypothetical protein